MLMSFTREIQRPPPPTPQELAGSRGQGLGQQWSIDPGIAGGWDGQDNYCSLGHDGMSRSEVVMAFWVGLATGYLLCPVVLCAKSPKLDEIDERTRRFLSDYRRSRATTSPLLSK